MVIDYDTLEEFRDPETYDLVCDAFAEDYPFMEQWARSLDGTLLDLACGTGRMALHLTAQGHQITGVDIVPEMIEYAHKKAAARALSIDWVVSDARNFHLNRQFRGIYMLMNAFQFLPTRTDYEALFASVREHLTPDGFFLFETRNPSPRNLFGLRTSEVEQFTATDGRHLTIHNQQVYEPLTQIQHYTSNYQWLYPDGHRTETVKRVALRYIFPQEMEALLHYNGMTIHACYGDWQQNPLTADSPAMIYICQKRT